MSLNTNAMDRLGPYTVESPIGSGSFGDIYLARTPEGKLVVIKKSKKREGMDAMWHERAFDTEARALHLIAGNYDGHNIVRLLDHHHSRDLKYIVLEYLPDGDLDRWRSRNSTLEAVEDNMRLFFVQLLGAIVYLHDMGIAHRDLKPANVLLRRSAFWTEERAKRSLLAFEPVLADFGTAAIRNEANADFASHHFQTFAGTLFFMAPEVKESQNGGGYSTLADVWSLGVLMLLFFIGTRNINPKANIEQLLQQHKGSMSREFFELLTDMLRPKPTERISWDRLVTHPWFKFPADHAFTLLEAQEAHEKIDALKRPADVEARHIKFGAVSRIPLATRGAHRSANASQYEFTSEEMLNAVSLDSEDGIVYCGLLEARELALNMEVKLRRLHEEWTLDKQKFYDTWLAPLHRRRGELDLTLSTYETFRAIATQRTLLKFAMAYQGNTRLILALEVAKVSMEKLRQISAQQGASGAHVRTNSGPNLASQQIASPSMQGSHIAQATGSHAQSTPLLNLSGTGANAATQIAAPSPMSPSDINFIRPDLARLWEKLFESARSVMRSHNVRDSEEDSNSPISLLGQGSDFPFFVIAHATCKLLYKECIDWLLPILDPSSAISNDLKDEDEEFLRRFTGASSPVPGPKPTPKTLEDVILRLKEIRLVMEYVRHVLPKNLSGAIHSQLSGSSLQFGNQSLLNSHLIIGSGTSTGTGGAKRSSTSYSGNSSSGFTSSPLGTSADLLSAADNERICLELIESLSKVIQRLPEEMKLLADNVVKQ